jgi:type I restriction enzyme S subunit
LAYIGKVIPMNDAWPKATIGSLFDIGAGKSVTPASRHGEPKRHFLRTSNVLWGDFDLSNVDQMFFDDDEFAQKSLRDGDLLICEGGDIGRAAVWRAKIQDCSFQNHLHRLRPARSDVSTDFMRYALEAGVKLFGLLDGVGNRTTIPNLSRNRLAGVFLPHPPLHQQEAIATVLAQVEAAVKTEADLLKVARELKQAALTEVFSRGLRGEERRETSYGVVPYSWAELPLSSCAHVQTGVAKNTRKVHESAIDVPYLRVANVQDGHLDLSEMKTIRLTEAEIGGSLLQSGDVVLTEGGDFDKLGRGFIWENQISRCVHQNHVFAVRTNRNQLDPVFFAYLAQSPYGKAYFLSVAHKTTNLACINTTKLRAFPVLIPEMKEQSEIGSILRSIDAKIAYHESRHRLLRELFTTLLRDLMTGRRRIKADGPC